MGSTIVLLLLVATLANGRGRETNVKGRHQLQLHAVLAYLGYRDDRIVEYKPHDVALNHTDAVKYCRHAGGAIARLEDRNDTVFNPRCML